MEREKIIGRVQIPPDKDAEARKRIKNVSDLGREIEGFLTASATELLETILSGAVYIDSSDIHIEPEQERAKLRVRIDGLLHDVVVFNIRVYHMLVDRIKLLAGIKLNVTNRPQDGRFTILMGGTSRDATIEIRASTLPSEYGETVVLRLLNPKNLIEIEALGLRPDLQELFKKEMKKPNGMMIVTGPTGSGKTTTLYAILKRINRPEVKIITIEDPVEYHLEGLSQTQIDASKGYTFANGLRSIVRQDPDVILVGEIRDKETAEIALQAALTGHLVFSTLHTNDAAGAVARLVDLGVNPTSIAPALNMVAAQRLPRRICQKCVEFVTPSQEDWSKIKTSLVRVKREILPREFFAKAPKIPHAKGCQLCNFTGYRGRIGVYEIFLIDDEMERFILKSSPIVDMRDLAIKKGMVLMRQDGLMRVLQGITTIEEIERITGD